MKLYYWSNMETDGHSVKSNKHVVWLVPGFAKDETDSTCLPYLQGLLRVFRKNFPEIKITVLSFQYPYRKGWYTLFGNDVYSADGRNRKGIRRLILWKHIRKVFRKVFKENPVDLIQSFWLSECALLGYYIAKEFSLPHFSYLMGQDALPENKYLLLLKLDKINVIALSAFSADLLEQTKNKKSFIIPFGLDVELIPALKKNQRSIDLLGAGSLIQIKNYSLFVEIVEELKKEFPTIRCELVGDGYEKNTLERIILEKKLAANLKLCGALPRENVLEKMMESKIFIHTSSIEGAGYVFIEALHYGCDLVSFDVGERPASDKVHTCCNKQEMIDAIAELLLSEKEYEPFKVMTMQETARQLIVHYGF